MTRIEMLRIARHGGFVRWNASGIIEQLFISRWNGALCARRAIDKRNPHEIDERHSDNRCERLTDRMLVTVGDLIR